MFPFCSDGCGRQSHDDEDHKSEKLYRDEQSYGPLANIEQQCQPDELLQLQCLNGGTCVTLVLKDDTRVTQCR